MQKLWMLLIPIAGAALLAGSSGSHVAVLATDKEPGSRLIVSGQVFDPSGTKPVAGVRLYAYHTDATGVYNKPGLQEPRLKATVVTDARGRFELRTIRPGSYPGRTDPAHIHFEASGAGYDKQWPDELQFTDDPNVTPRMLAESKARGKFASIVTPRRDARGVLHATLNIRLRN
jgi:protocatechuate 3,4-dioxygenase, beta subunit